MILLAAAAAMLAVWVGAWIAGMDMGLRRDYFTPALVAALMPIWRLPLAMVMMGLGEAVRTPFYFTLFAIVWWILAFVLMMLVAGRSLGCNFRQALIVSVTVLGSSLLLSVILPLLLNSFVS